MREVLSRQQVECIATYLDDAAYPNSSEKLLEHDADQRKQIEALQRWVERYQAALESIAKPALGGKLQQYTAQEALKEPHEARG